MLIWLKNQGKVRYRTFQLRPRRAPAPRPARAAAAHAARGGGARGEGRRDAPVVAEPLDSGSAGAADASPWRRAGHGACRLRTRQRPVRRQKRLYRRSAVTFIFFFRFLRIRSLLFSTVTSQKSRPQKRSYPNVGQMIATQLTVLACFNIACKRFTRIDNV